MLNNNSEHKQIEWDAVLACNKEAKYYSFFVRASGMHACNAISVKLYICAKWTVASNGFICCMLRFRDAGCTYSLLKRSQRKYFKTWSVPQDITESMRVAMVKWTKSISSYAQVLHLFLCSTSTSLPVLKSCIFSYAQVCVSPWNGITDAWTQDPRSRNTSHCNFIS